MLGSIFIIFFGFREIRLVRRRLRFVFFVFVFLIVFVFLDFRIITVSGLRFVLEELLFFFGGRIGDIIDLFFILVFLIDRFIDFDFKLVVLNDFDVVSCFFCIILIFFL